MTKTIPASQNPQCIAVPKYGAVTTRGRGVSIGNPFGPWRQERAHGRNRKRTIFTEKNWVQRKSSSSVLPRKDHQHFFLHPACFTLETWSMSHRHLRRSYLSTDRRRHGSWTLPWLLRPRTWCHGGLRRCLAETNHFVGISIVNHSIL